IRPWEGVGRSGPGATPYPRVFIRPDYAMLREWDEGLHDIQARARRAGPRKPPEAQRADREHTRNLAGMSPDGIARRAGFRGWRSPRGRREVSRCTRLRAARRLPG